MTPVAWQEEAAFVAEFCALGGQVTARFTAPIDLGDPKVAHALPGRRRRRRACVWGLLVPPEFLPALALARLACRPGWSSAITCWGLQHARARSWPPAGVVGARLVHLRQTQHLRRAPDNVLEGVSGLPPSDGNTGRAGLQRRHGGPAARARGLGRRPVGWSSTAARAGASEIRRSFEPCAPRPKPPGSPQHLPEAESVAGAAGGCSSS